MADDLSNAWRAEQPEEEADFDIGVLFIHGIGAQQRGQTLAEFGGPIYLWLVDRLRGLNHRWRDAIRALPQSKAKETLEQWRPRIEDWATDGFHCDEHPVEPDADALAQLAEQLGCDTAVARVRLTDTLIENPEDPTAPAHATLLLQRQRIEGNIEAERWVLAESWWAETFSPPGFSDLARWGLRIIPWAVGNHFGAQVQRVLAQRPGRLAQSRWWEQTLRWLAWLWPALARCLGLGIGLLASPLLLAALGVLLLAALLPIPQVREALLKLQLRIASTLGDSYMLVTHPIEAASIIGQVRRDMGWLAKRCRVVAVVAHSQGGAVAHKALQSGMPPELKLLFTFGSGLKKLEQLEHVLSSGRTYIHSAIITLIALKTFTLACVVLILAMLLPIPGWSPDLPETALLVTYALVALTFLGAGLRDHVRGIVLADLKRWVQRLEKRPLDWVDCFAAADPVSNGVLLDDPAVKKSSKEVCNQSSVLRDHTSYWANRDQFVSLLMQRLTRPQLRENAGLPPAPELATDFRTLDWIGKRWRWRVGILSAIRWAGALSVLLAVHRESHTWWNFLEYWSFQILAWGRALLGYKSIPENDMTVSWPALGYLALVLVPYWVTRQRWGAWNDVEMRTLVESRVAAGEPLGDFWVTLGLGVQVTIAAWFLFRGAPPLWVVMVLAYGVLAAVRLTMVSPEPAAQVKSKFSRIGVSSDEALSEVDKLRRWFWQLSLILTLPIMVWDCFIWLADGYFDDLIPGFRPSQLSTGGIGFYAIAAALTVILLPRARVWLHTARHRLSRRK